MEKTVSPYKGLMIHLLMEEGRLSIIGETRHSCGQIHDSIHTRPKAWNEGWDKQKLTALLNVWKRWHLNNIRAGSPAQEEALRQANFEEGYLEALKFLKERNLEPDTGYLVDGKPYKYGSKWLKEELPSHVVEFLEAL